ncbi:MAG: TerB family tellurite resistance protein [Ignavibacteriaceae bacterium]|nr:TerB family tellurite resistance protein [Ignavibacteriaceae bacterium]
MFDYLRKILLPEVNKSVVSPESKPNKSEAKKLEVATCALFVEMAKADGEFSEDERKKIVKAMKETFDLENEFVNDLIELSEQKIKESISIYEFTSTINDNFSKEDKFELMKNLWKLIYIDEKLNMYEDHLVKKIGGMLNLDHKKIIEAKLIVKEEKGL